MPSPASTTTSSSKLELRRDLGLWTAIAIVIGTTIGSAIFIVPRTMINELGSPWLVVAVWVAGGVLSLFGTLTYAELASMYPHAGAEYVYLREAYGPFFGFTYGWLQTLVIKSGSMATLATGMFLYMARFVPALEHVAFTIPLPIGPKFGPLEIRYGQLLGIAVILALGWMNTLGVKLGGRVHFGLTVLKLSMITGIVVCGLLVGAGDWGHMSAEAPVAASEGGLFERFFAALVAALWAYEGWSIIAMVGSEVRDPQRNLPKALVGGVAGIITVYLLATFAYFRVLTPVEIGQSERVAATMMSHLFGDTGSAVISVAAILSIFAALNGTLLGGSRVPYAMARDGLFFRRAAEIDVVHHTPNYSIGVVTVCSGLVLLSGRYDELFTAVIFAGWILYGMTAVAVIVLRGKRPELERPFRVPGYPLVPALVAVTAIILLYATMQRSPRESLMGLAIIALGIPFYWNWRRQ